LTNSRVTAAAAAAAAAAATTTTTTTTKTVNKNNQQLMKVIRMSMFIELSTRKTLDNMSVNMIVNVGPREAVMLLRGPTIYM